MYKVLKVINNNALLANDLTTNDEVIFLGTGVGFGRKTNDLFDEIINAKKYFTTDKIKDISQNIDPIYLDIAELILQQAQTQFATIDYMIQFALADHIAFAIKRMKNNITIVNPFSTDISLLYKKEYEIALQGAKIIEDKLGVMINSDEVGYITLHIHSALGKDNVAESLRIAMIINDALARLENLCHVTLNKESSAYARFLVHLKYMFYRLNNNEVLNLDMNDYAQTNFKNSYDIAKEVLSEIEKLAKVTINEVEIGYFAIHIERILQS